MPINSLKDIGTLIDRDRHFTVAVVCPHKPENVETLHGVADELNVGFALIGARNDIDRALGSAQAPSDYQIIPSDSPEKAIQTAIRMASSSEADIILKGSVETADLIRAVLKSDLRIPGRFAHHMSVFEWEGRFDDPEEQRLVISADEGINVNPTPEQRAIIAHGCLELCEKLKLSDTPRVAFLAPSEIRMFRDAFPPLKDLQRDFPNALFGGPFSSDVALSKKIARLKNLEKCPVAGKADVLVHRMVDGGNAFHKSHAAHGVEFAGFFHGTKTSIAAVSRGDSVNSNIASVRLALAMC